MLKPLIDKMQALLVGLGMPDAVSQIVTVRQQLRVAGSAGYLCAGMPNGRPVYLIKDDSNGCLHASNTETIPAGQPVPANFEVYHLPLRDDNDKTDLWKFADLGDGRSLTNEAYGRVLHASNSVVMPQGHKVLYTCAPANNDHAEEFSIVPSGSPDPFTFNGYFRLASIRTNLRATYGQDITPRGRPRVHQESGGSRIYFYRPLRSAVQLLIGTDGAGVQGYESG